MTLASSIKAAHAKHPHWSPRQIAEAVDCSPEYVRTVAQRHGINLPYGYTVKGKHVRIPLTGPELIRLENWASAAKITPTALVLRIVREALV